MQRIDLTESPEQDKGSAVPHQADHPAGPLLLCAVRTDADDFGPIDPLVEALTAEGWNVLDVPLAPIADVAAAAAQIVNALADATSTLSGAPRVVIIAAADAVPAALAVVLALPAIAAIVTVDTPMSDADMAKSLAAIEGLTTLTVASRQSSQARRHGLALHRRLQSLDRDTHFMVQAESDRALSHRLSDPRDPLGRELRWLIDPVNSRSG
jgi:hypothetical protein